MLNSSMTADAEEIGGFSVIELIMVVIIILILIMMLIPVIASSREAAQRVTCTNNLKQIMLALGNYEITLRTLPPGCVDYLRPVTNEQEGYRFGWAAQLLPYVEQSMMASSLDVDRSIFDPVNAMVLSTVIRTLHCPSDENNLGLSSTFAGNLTGIQPTLAGPRSPGSSNFAACHHDEESPIDINQNGVFFLNSRVRSEEVFDGTSNTIYLGEKLNAPPDLGWVTGTRASLRNTGHPINSQVSSTQAADVRFVGGFASRHEGGANFGLGDGSVRFIHESINRELFRRLGNRADGELTQWDR